MIAFNFDYLEPCIIFNSTMTLSAFFAVLNVLNWNLYVGADTCIIIILGLLSFTLGSFFVTINYLSGGELLILKLNIRIIFRLTLLSY